MTKKLIKRNAVFLARGVEKVIFQQKPLRGRSLSCSIKEDDGDCNPKMLTVSRKIQIKFCGKSACRKISASHHWN